MRAIYTAYVALGSNLGDRADLIISAANMLRDTPGVLRVRLSPLLENPAAGMAPGTPSFLNGAAEVVGELLPRPLLQRLLEIERALGRERRNDSRGDARPASRPVDLDLLLHGPRVIDEPDLKLPHPRMHERRFVLAPLAELAPDAVHPVLRLTAAELLRRLPVG